MRVILRIFHFIFYRFFWIYGLLVLIFLVVPKEQLFEIKLMRIGNLQFFEAQIANEVFNANVISLERHHLRAAIQYYKELLKILPPRDYVYGNMAFCYSHLKEYDQSIRLYNEAAQLNPNIYTYFWDKGMIYFHQRKYKQAALTLNQALETMPQTVYYYQDLLASEHPESFIQNKESFLFYFLEQIDRDRKIAELQIFRCYLYLENAYEIQSELRKNIVFLRQYHNLLKNKEILESFILNLNQYHWENLSLEDRFHFDFFIGPQLTFLELVFQGDFLSKQK